jgi:hypothetical protein
MDQVSDIISRVISLKDSTTLLLESLSARPLKVMLESQVETKDPNEEIIKRTVKLFFDSVSMPVLFCVSELHRKKLKAEEYKWLNETLMPIGKIFGFFNPEVLIKKNNILITRHHDPAIAALLNVKFQEITCKKYDYWVGDRKIGAISEFFNEESLDRIWDTKNIGIF